MYGPQQAVTAVPVVAVAQPTRGGSMGGLIWHLAILGLATFGAFALYREIKKGK